MLDAGNIFSLRRDYLWDNTTNSREVCPCDYDLSELLKVHTELNIRGLFHMGSGGHHHVGLATHQLGIQTVAITFSETEHQRYLELLEIDQNLGSSYICFVGNLYSTPFEVLGPFDCASLFHICESGGTIEDASRAVNRVLGSVVENGLVIFYTNSNGWEKARVVRDQLVAAGRISPFCDPINNLILYRKIH